MNKKFGLVFMFLGAYIVLLGGLFWNMLAPDPSLAGPEGTGFHPVNVYDWFWGLSCAVVIACGAGLATKKNLIFGIIGCVLGELGVAYGIGILAVGQSVENYFSVAILIGIIIAQIGIVFALLTHIVEYQRFKKYGPTLM